MKNFVFYIVSEKWQKNSGYRTLELSIHKISKNKLTKCNDNLIVSTGNYKGCETEVMYYLSKNGFISKKYSEGNYKENNQFVITGI